VLAALDAERVEAAERLALALRRADVPVRFLGVQKKDKVFKYSTASELPRVVLVGEEEARTGIYPLRDADSRQERRMTEAELIAALKG
jgi:histidyl-tRNA synthetase